MKTLRFTDAECAKLVEVLESYQDVLLCGGTLASCGPWRKSTLLELEQLRKAFNGKPFTGWQALSRRNK